MTENTELRDFKPGDKFFWRGDWSGGPDTFEVVRQEPEYATTVAMDTAGSEWEFFDRGVSVERCAV